MTHLNITNIIKRNVKILALIITFFMIMTNFIHSAFATPDLCGFYSRDLEEKYYLPHNLLHAIAIVETGKYDRLNHKREAWAWTVSDNGTNKMKYASKALAIKHILHLQKSKIYDINVGCLQLNYKLYSAALGKPYTALSPAVNMKYGAKLLKSIYDRTQDWKISVEFFQQANYSKIDKNYYAKVQQFIHNLNAFEHNQQERKRSHQRRLKALDKQRNDLDKRRIKRKTLTVGKPNLGGHYEKETSHPVLAKPKSTTNTNTTTTDKSQGYTPQPIDSKRTEELNKINQAKFKQQHPTARKLYRHHSNEAPTVSGGSTFFNKHNSK